jgi:hypothetical protein
VRQTRRWSLLASESVEGQKTPWKAATSVLHMPAGIPGVSIGTSQRYNSLWALLRLDGTSSCIGSRARPRSAEGASFGSHHAFGYCSFFAWHGSVGGFGYRH